MPPNACKSVDNVTIFDEARHHRSIWTGAHRTTTNSLAIGPNNWDFFFTASAGTFYEIVKSLNRSLEWLWHRLWSASLVSRMKSENRFVPNELTIQFQMQAMRIFFAFGRLGDIRGLKFTNGRFVWFQIPDLDDDDLRNLLEEAITYKRPKDRENKSEMFKVWIVTE